MAENYYPKQGSKFITSDQCNYLGIGHVTVINITQSTCPLTLVHDRVRRCLSIERSGLLDFVRPLVFDLPLGRCGIIRDPLFYKMGSNALPAEAAPMEKAKSE